MAEGIALEFTDPEGEPVRIEWNAGALAGLDLDAEQPPWRLGGELDWDEVEALRVLSARMGSSRLLAAAAIRPREAAGHGEEIVSGALGGPDGFEGLARTLISTEYDEDGRPRRIGLELYRDEDGLPLRVAGEATARAEADEGELRRSRVAFAIRAGGEQGVAVLDVVRRG